MPFDHTTIISNAHEAAPGAFELLASAQAHTRSCKCRPCRALKTTAGKRKLAAGPQKPRGLQAAITPTLAEVREASLELRACRFCRAPLVLRADPDAAGNWYPSALARGSHRCIDCSKRINEANRKATRVNGPKIDRSRSGIKARRKRGLFNQKRRSAQHVGIPFTITFEDVRWPNKCPYLATSLDYTGRLTRTSANQRIIPSFDRIDPTKGYIPGNVQVISYKANALKRDRTLAELVTLAREATPETTAGREDLRTFYASVIRRHG